MKLLLALFCLGLGGSLVAQASVDPFWPEGGDEALDPSVHLTFSLDMAGPSGVAEFSYDKSASVQILSAVLVLSMDGGPMFCQEIGLDLAQSTANNAVLRTVKSDKGLTAVEFTSALNFIRKQAGLLSVTYSVAGKVKTAYNDRLIESRLLGKWMFDGGDTFPVLFRPNHTVLWGNGLDAPWRVTRGLLTIGDEPMLQKNSVELNGERVTLHGQTTSIRLARDFGSDRNQPQEPVSEKPHLNKLKAPEDYEFEEVGQRVNWGPGDEVLEGFSNPKATKQTISGTKNGLRFIVVSSDPASAIVVFKGGKEISRQSAETGFLFGLVLEDETDQVELHGVGFNPESKHFNTWCEMYMTSSIEDATEQAKSIMAAWQARENKPWVVFIHGDGSFEDLVR